MTALKLSVSEPLRTKQNPRKMFRFQAPLGISILFLPIHYQIKWLGLNKYVKFTRGNKCDDEYSLLNTCTTPEFNFSQVICVLLGCFCTLVVSGAAIPPKKAVLPLLKQIILEMLQETFSSGDCHHSLVGRI